MPIGDDTIHYRPPEAEFLAEPAQEVIASWYGPRFHGKRTASGEIFNQHEMTAAHPHWPFGTRVRVTNPDTGARCVVTITDRGPHTPGRELDVSRAAARKLGIVKKGVARIRAAPLP